MQQQPLIDQLKAIVADLDIDAEGNVSFKGSPQPSADHPNASLDARLYFHLVNVLYSNCYTGQFGETDAPAMATPEEAAAFVERLKAANHNRERFDHGWTVDELEHGGNILVRKGASRRTTYPGDFLRDGRYGQSPLQQGEPVKLLARPEMAEDPNTGGFYHAFGETLLDFNPQNWARLYFNLVPDGAEKLLDLLSAKLGEWQVPYQFKCLHNPVSYGRHDSAVLYFDKRYYGIIMDVLQAGYAKISPWLMAGVPLFAKQVAEGIGFAENPFDPNESFGTSRCKVVAQGLVEAWKQQAPKVQWPHFIQKSIENAFLNADAFYLNPNSKYPYYFEDLKIRGFEDLSRQEPPFKSTNPQIHESSKYMTAAIRLGNRICRDAIRHGGRANWVAAGSDPEQPMSLKPYYRSLKGDWYSGTSGIAFFLANLYSVSGERLHREVAIEAMLQALDTVPEVEHAKLGFHAGVTGIGFAAVHVGELLARPDLIEQGLQAIISLNDLPFDDYTLDVVDGCAGAIPAVLNIAKRYPSPELGALLEKMGRHLLQTMQKEPSGYSWPTFPGASSNLTGLAHGTSGIAAALLELWAHTGNATYLNVATGGFAYEESHFVPGQKNWPDFRNFSSPGNLHQAEPSETVCGCAWCHGAPGIGLARLRAFQLTKQPNYRHFAEQAIETTTASLVDGQLANFSLCHGVCGNADLLLVAADVLGDESLAQKAQNAVERLITDFEEKGAPIPNGAQNDCFVPDMMLGLAGMGYCLLRLEDRERFGSVLILN